MSVILDGVLWTPIPLPPCGVRDDDPHDGDAPRYVIEQLELGRATGAAAAPRPPLHNNDLAALHAERLLPGCAPSARRARGGNRRCSPSTTQRILHSDQSVWLPQSFHKSYRTAVHADFSSKQLHRALCVGELDNSARSRPACPPAVHAPAPLGAASVVRTTATRARHARVPADVVLVVVATEDAPSLHAAQLDTFARAFARGSVLKVSDVHRDGREVHARRALQRRRQPPVRGQAARLLLRRAHRGARQAARALGRHGGRRHVRARAGPRTRTRPWSAARGAAAAAT